MAKQENNESKWQKWKNGVRSEFNKIIWPTRDDIQKETTAVVVVGVLLGVLIAMIDFIVQHGVDILVNIKF